MARDAPSPRGARAGRPLPLNSKHLTAVYLSAIATAMEIPTKGSVAETRQMVEGKLSDHGREPTNVQVVIEEDEDGVECVSLTDVSGVFLGPEAIHDARGNEDGESESQSQEEKEESEAEDRSDTLCLEGELAEIRTRSAELEAKVSSLNDDLMRERERVNGMWKSNCAQVAAFDETLSAKDDEIRTSGC